MKNSADNKTSSSNYRPVMNCSNLLKMFEYLVLLHLKKYLTLSHSQFAYRPSVGCLKARKLLKEIISHLNQNHSDVFCAMIDPSQAYDRTNINTLFTKLKQSELPDQITNIMEYIFGRTIVHSFYWFRISYCYVV